jgi:superfamily II RNA helicase
MLKQVSPLACLNQLNSEGDNLSQIVSNICLTPNDTHKLYTQMAKIFAKRTETNRPDFQELTKFSHFSNKEFITRNDVQNFEIYLKSHLQQMASNNDMPELLELLRENHTIEQGAFVKETDLPKLVEHLNASNLLPALVFCFDRRKCENSVRILLKHYDEKEKLLRSTKYKAKIEKLRKLRELASKKPKDAKPKKNDQNTDNKMYSNDQSESTDFSLLDHFLPECILGEALFFGEGEVQEKLKKAFGDDKDDWRKRAIERGFFFHHSGLNAKKRVCIESFFRVKRVKLLFCTTTLAQGILLISCKTNNP